MSTNNNQPQSPLEYPANDQVPVRIFRRNRAPLTTDYRNFTVRDFWNDTSSNDLWYLTSKTTISGVWIKLGGGTTGDIQFLAGDSGGNIPPNSSGVVGVLGGSNITTAGSGNDVEWNLDDNIEVTSISFDSGSNLLNYYETGSIVPVLSFGGGTTGITYSNQDASYTRIGKFVHVNGNITLTSKGSDTGVAEISGLPFTSNLTSAGTCLWSGLNIDTAGGFTAITIRVPASSSVIDMFESGDNVGSTALTDADFTNSVLFTFSLQYMVA